MNIYEAMRKATSGSKTYRFRRPHFAQLFGRAVDGGWCDPLMDCYSFRREDFLAEDWELDEPCCDVEFDPNHIPRYRRRLNKGEEFKICIPCFNKLRKNFDDGNDRYPSL